MKYTVHNIFWRKLKQYYELLITVECIDEFQINEINVDLRTSGFDNEVISVDACAVW